MLNSTNTGRISKCCRTNKRRIFLGIAASASSSAITNKAQYSSSEEFISFQNTIFATFFILTRKEHTESTCYFYVNRRARIAYSEYRIAYSKYRIAYTVYFYLNAAFKGCVHIEIYGIRYMVFAIRYSVFAIHYTGTAVHIEVARSVSVLFS